MHPRNASAPSTPPTAQSWHFRVHATRTRSLALAAAFATVGAETLLCGRHRFHCLALQIRHQRQLTRIRSLSRRTRRAVAARVFAHLLGAERERRPPSFSFRCHLTPRGRGFRCCAGSLGRSSKARCAEQQRRGAAAHRRCPTAVPTESLPYPAAILLLPPSSPRGRLRRAGPALLARAPLPVPSRQRTDGQLGLAEVGCG